MIPPCGFSKSEFAWLTWLDSFDHIRIYVTLFVAALYFMQFFILFVCFSIYIVSFFTQPCIYLLMNFKHSWHLYFVFAFSERVIVIAF